MKNSRLAYIFVLIAFLINTICPSGVWAYGSAALTTGGNTPLQLPKPGIRVSLSAPLNPPMLKGIKVHPDNPFRFDFILDKGDRHPAERSDERSQKEQPRSDSSALSAQNDRDLKEESTRLIKYFLASLTVPERDLWVNLSPYEKDRIVPASFGQTEMGRDLLAQDYLLKQITASLIYPEDELGKKFWKRIYAEAVKKYGSANIPVNTFNKVWIVPEKAVVYENAIAGTAYVVESRLKVMLEADYVALSKNNLSAESRAAGDQGGQRGITTERSLVPAVETEGTRDGFKSSMASQVIREIVLPALETEINTGANFAQLRQVYNSLILATWYKKKIKDSLLAQVYADQNKVVGIGYQNNVGAGSKPAQATRVGLSKDALWAEPTPTDVERIYQQYLQAFKKGVYNYIKEESDPVTGQLLPRKYFSGGFTGDMASLTITSKSPEKFPDHAMKVSVDMALVSMPRQTINDLFNHELLNDSEAYSLFGPSFLPSHPSWMDLSGDPVQVDWDYSSQKISSVRTLSAPRYTKGQYHYKLPINMTLRDVIVFIKSFRSLPMTDHDVSLFSLLSERFKRVAYYLIQHYRGQVSDHVIQLYYTIGLIFQAQKTTIFIPTMEEILKQKETAFTAGLVKKDFEEMMLWLGLEDNELIDEEKLSKRARLLVQQGLQLEIETISYWRGMNLLKQDLNNNRVPIKKRPKRDSSNEVIDMVGLKRSIQNASNPERRAAEEKKVIMMLLEKMSRLSGWQTKIVEAFPGKAREAGEINCVGRSALLASYIHELKAESSFLEVWSVNVYLSRQGEMNYQHILLLVRLSNEEYYLIEPSIKTWFKGIDPQVMKPVENPFLNEAGQPLSVGQIIDFKRNGKGVEKIVRGFVNQWRLGLMGAYYYNLAEHFDPERTSVASSTKGIAVDPHESGSFYVLGQARFLRQEWEEALPMFSKAVIVNPHDYHSWLHLGKIYEKKKQDRDAMHAYRQAEKVLKEAIKLDSKHSVLYGLLAEVSVGLKNYDQARRNCQKFIKLDPKNTHFRLALGEIYLLLKWPNRARNYFKRFLFKNSWNSRAHRGLAMAYMQLKQYPEAVINFEEAREGGYGDSELYLELGLAYLANEQFMEAQKNFKRYIRVVPEDPKGYLYRAQALEHLEDTRQAEIEHSYEEAIARDENFVDALLGLAAFYEKHGMNKKAMGVYDQLRAIMYRSEDTAGVLQAKKYLKEVIIKEVKDHWNQYQDIFLGMKLEDISIETLTFPTVLLVLIRKQKILMDQEIAFLEKRSGGIDFKSDQMKIELRGNEEKGITFNIDPAMLKRFYNAPGFEPVIIDFQPMTNFQEFLGVIVKVGTH